MSKTNKFIKNQGDRYRKTLISQKSPVIVNQNESEILYPEISHQMDTKIFSQQLMIPIIMALEPKDLLSLYITDKQFDYFNNENILSLLNNKYHLDASSFPEFIKLYNKSTIDKKLLYLYDLENELEYPNNEFVSRFINKEYNITNASRATTLDWMFTNAVKLTHAFNQLQFRALAATYFDAYLYKNPDMSKDDLQLLACVCLSLAEYMIVDDREDVYFYTRLANNSFTVSQFNNKLNDVFNTLDGILIRPCTALFIEMNEQTKHLVNFSYLIPELMKFKPSMIAEAISYIVYGYYKIYDKSELNYICNKLYGYVTRIDQSPFQLFKIYGKKALLFMKNQCGSNIKEFTDSPFKISQPWHLGEYQKLNIIGQGAYGKVVRIKKCNQNDIQEYVIKTNLEDKSISLMEIAMIKQLDQPNVINICHFILEGEKVKIIMPYMGASMDKLITEKNFNKNHIVRYFKQLCLGLQECHRNDIIHRDMKVENVIYDEANDSFKIIDFGISVSYASVRYYLDPDMACSYYYRAPEALIGSKNYNYKVDIWALGVIFYYILSGKYIFYDYNNLEALNDIFRIFGQPSFDEWPELYKYENVEYLSKYPRDFARIEEIFVNYKQLLLPCFIINPDNRPDTKQLLAIAEKFY